MCFDRKAIAALLVLAVSGCSIIQPSSVTIKNESSLPINDVMVNFAGEAARLDTVAQGSTVTLKRRPSRDGGITLSFLRDGRKFSQELAYVAPPFRTVCEVTIERVRVRRHCRI